jgi:RNA polymerase sigma-70 factor (ECF subfamily)
MTDDQAIARVLDGDTESFRTLVERYERPLFGLIRNLIDDHHECEDIAQATLLAAYARLASYDRNRAAFVTWLLTIARNKCLSVLKKKRPVAVDVLPEVRRADADRQRRAESDVFLCLDGALARLPLPQKTAFVLAEIEGFSYVEVARIEQLQLGTVKSRINRARASLRRALDRMSEVIP